MDELDVFVAVAEEQGFSAAAKRLDSTPAAVSRRIKAIEQRLAAADLPGNRVPVARNRVAQSATAHGACAAS